MNVTDTKHSPYIRFTVRYGVVSWKCSQLDNACFAELLPLSDAISIFDFSTVGL
jgi:hypothetical protein